MTTLRYWFNFFKSFYIINYVSSLKKQNQIFAFINAKICLIKFNIYSWFKKQDKTIQNSKKQGMRGTSLTWQKAPTKATENHMGRFLR